MKASKPMAVLVLLLVSVCAPPRIVPDDARHTKATELVGQLGSQDVPTKMSAVRELANLGDAAVPALVQAMYSHADDEMGAWVSIALRTIGAPSVRSLTIEVHNSKASVRRHAIVTLHQIGRASSRAIPELIVALDDEDPSVREPAVRLLGYLGDPCAIKPLAGRLNKERETIVTAALIAAIGAFGAEARDAVPALLSIVRRPSSYYEERIDWSSPGFSAARALAKTGSVAALPLARVFQDATAPRIARVSAAWGLAFLKDDGAEAVPNLAHGLEDREADIRRMAALALGEIGGRAVKATTALLRALGDDVPLVRAQAALALQSVEPGNEPAFRMLLQCLLDPDWFVRWQAATGLGKCSEELNKSIGHISKLLKDDDSRVRIAATRALGNAGAHAVVALPALRAAARTDPGSDVRDWAADAIRRIEARVREKG